MNYNLMSDNALQDTIARYQRERKSIKDDTISEIKNILPDYISKYYNVANLSSKRLDLWSKESVDLSDLAFVFGPHWNDVSKFDFMLDALAAHSDINLDNLNSPVALFYKVVGKILDDENFLSLLKRKLKIYIYNDTTLVGYINEIETILSKRENNVTEELSNAYISYEDALAEIKKPENKNKYVACIEHREGEFRYRNRNFTVRKSWDDGRVIFDSEEEAKKYGDKALLISKLKYKDGDLFVNA